MNKIVVGNWKMNPPSKKEAEFLLSKISQSLKNIKGLNVVICPPFPYLFLKSKSKKITIGAQNVSIKTEGSWTGEVSVSMLKSFSLTHVILGHSERRSQGEENEEINEKLINVLKAKLSPILCIGEKERDRDGNYLSFIEDQIKKCFLNVPKSDVKKVIIAYEPVWAIGKDSKREATKEEFIETKIFIKKIISDLYDLKTAHDVKIIYGGSVNKDNANLFVKEGQADGLLVGRDSLNYKNFEQIIRSIN